MAAVSDVARPRGVHAVSLRQVLREQSPVIVPGCFNAFFARLIEQSGFPAVYLSGAGVANHHVGRPDLGVVSLDEMVGVLERLADVVSVPIFADADTGYGGIHNVARTVRRFERAGVSAIQLEDQEFPKMCGHFEGKRVVAVEEMLQRLDAAQTARVNPETMIVARTDAASPLGIDEAIRRARIYGEAGADALFVEAPTSRDDLARIGDELGEWPLVANMVEFGKTPLLTADELGELGFSIIIYPGAISRTITKAAREMLSELQSAGTTANYLDNMESFQNVNAVVGLSDHRAWEEAVAAGQASS